MKISRIIAAVLSLCMVGGAFTFNSTAVRDYSITADAAGECYTFNSTTGVLTLRGNVVLEEITEFDRKEAVKSIKAAEGTVFPGRCNELFEDYSNCISIDLKNADTSEVYNMGHMFEGCSSLTSLDLSSFNTSEVYDMWYMFKGCSSLTSLDLSSFNISKVGNMSSMFEGCSSLTSLDISSFNTCNVYDTCDMFKGCSSLTSLDLSNFKTKEACNTSSMFYGCSSLTSLVLGDISAKDSASFMFYGCSSLTSLDLELFVTTDLVYNIDYMFAGCSSLTSLDLSMIGGDTIESAYGLFSGCTSLSELTLGKDFGDIAEGHKLPNGKGWVNTNDPSTIISGSGKYAAFTNDGMNTYVQFATSLNKKGDINGDSVIDGTDATLALKEYASLGQGISTLTAAQTAAADVNGSGNVDGSDATMILRYYALAGGGVTPDWDHIFD